MEQSRGPMDKNRIMRPNQSPPHGSTKPLHPLKPSTIRDVNFTQTSLQLAPELRCELSPATFVCGAFFKSSKKAAPKEAASSLHRHAEALSQYRRRAFVPPPQPQLRAVPEVGARLPPDPHRVPSEEQFARSEIRAHHGVCTAYPC
jgi:hypothetical protein